MLKNYDQSVETNPNEIDLIFLIIFMEDLLLVVRDQGKLMCY